MFNNFISFALFSNESSKSFREDGLSVVSLNCEGFISPSPLNLVILNFGSEDFILFCCNQRGIDTEKAIALIVNGFSKEVLNKLPMEFAVEAQKLLEISLEGSVG